MSLSAKARPDARDVATRATVLRSVVVHAVTAPSRSVLAEALERMDPAEYDAFRADAELRREAFFAELWPVQAAFSPCERRFARSTLVTMSETQQIDASWRIEALQVLLWALWLFPELPPYDAQAPHSLLDDFAPADLRVFLEGATLRPEEELDHAREAAELWHWRSRTRGLVEAGYRFPADPRLRAAGLGSFEDAVRQAAARGFASGRIAGMIDSDFAACGKAYRDLSADEWAGVRSVTLERHFALNWLCGWAPEHAWDETPTET